jgi:DNA-binding NarL/FixJ family response regulator
MDEQQREQILARYREHAERFERLAALAEAAPLPAPPANGDRPPTSRELEVLQLIADGLSNHEIGKRLVVSDETVKSHVRQLLAKLGAGSRAHAVAVGMRAGLVA